MSFIIEPAQTLWSPTDRNHQILNCVLRMPLGSVIVGIRLNHLLVKRQIFTRATTDDDYRHAEMTAILLGIPFGESVLRPAAEFLGVMNIGERLNSYAVFVQPPLAAFSRAEPGSGTS